MARILYGVAKEGMGHAIRSRIILGELSKRHELLIIAGGKPFDYLSKYFKNVKKIDDFDLVYRNNSISFIRTFFRNLIKFPRILYYFSRILKKAQKFQPDIVISDFESLAGYLSLLLKKPLISIDNQHVCTKCAIDVPARFIREYSICCFIVSLMILRADHFLITTYFFPKKKFENVHLFPPILRKELFKKQPKNKDHILVYQTTSTNKSLVPLLAEIDENFVYYGPTKGKKGNIVFRQFSEKAFVEDLSTCKAVLTNGGFGLIGEALSLKKPVLSVPVKGQFEQILNAVYLEKLGFGQYHMELTKEKIDNFISRIPSYRRNLSKARFSGNARILAKLEKLIKSYTS